MRKRCSAALFGPRTMAIDHPFFYAVTDEETGALLFIGTLVKPT
jgi:serine protease inhibitor